jgi:acyl-CoA thioesterase FadM
MSTMVSRWPVRIALDVSRDELDDDARLTEAAVVRCFEEARRVYFDDCTTVSLAELTVRDVGATIGAAPIANARLTISVNVVELYPDAFTMSARLRPTDDDGVAASATVTLVPVDGVTNAMRDEFIARAHAARFTH